MISHSSVTGAMSYQWWDVTVGAFRGQGGGLLSAEGTGQQYAWQSGTAEWVFTPSVTTVVQLRVVGVNNSSNILSESGAAPISTWKIGAPYIDIEQLGTTNTTAFTGSIANDWNIINSYPSGTIVVKDSQMYQANAFIESGTAFVVGTTGATWELLNSSGLVSGTPVTASGTVVDFTGIPSTAKRITVMFSGLSTNGTSGYIIRFRVGGTYLTTGYAGSCDDMTSTVGPSLFTTGFQFSDTTTLAAAVVNGQIMFTKLSDTVWVGGITGGWSNTGTVTVGGGTITVGGSVDAVRITTLGGVNTFDTGTVNIIYE
jgi:hypothetical protein